MISKLHFRVTGNSRARALGAMILVLPGAVTLFPSGTGGRAKPNTSGDTLSSTQVATITTDTGAFAPGWRDFSRYTDVGQCLVAAKDQYERGQRSLAARQRGDVADIYMDTVGVGATVPIARACMARFTMATTPQRDWDRLFELALYARDSKLALAVLNAQLARARPRAAMPHVRAVPDSVGRYTEAMEAFYSHGWPQAAESLASDIDTRLPDYLDLRVRVAHEALERALQNSEDTATLHAASDRVLRLTHAPQSYLPMQYYFAELNAWAARYLLPAVWLHADSMLAVAAQEKESISRLRFTDTLVLGIPAYPGSANPNHWMDFPNFPLTTVLTAEGGPPEWLTWRLRGGGGVAPRLTAAYWFPPPGRPASDTVWPVPGKVNLLCTGGKFGDVDDGFTQHRLAVLARSVLKQYGTDQLAVALVFPAGGYDYVGEGWDTHDQWFGTRAEEAAALRWYVQTYEGLPVTVAVQARNDQWLPPPDSRRLTQTRMQFNTFFASDPDVRVWEHYNGIDTTFGNRFGETPDACVIVGRDGMVRNAIYGFSAKYVGRALKMEMTPGATSVPLPPGGFIRAWGIQEHYWRERVNPYRLPAGQYKPPVPAPVNPPVAATPPTQ